MAKHAANDYAAGVKAKVAFTGIGLGVALFALLLCLLQYALPQQSELDNNLNYGYVYSGAKSSSLEFVEAASSDNSVLLFGSSELSTPSSTVPEVPAEVFGTNNYGIDLTLVGEAYDQSLWQAIAAGAYAPPTDRRATSAFAPSASCMACNMSISPTGNTRSISCMTSCISGGLAGWLSRRRSTSMSKGKETAFARAKTRVSDFAAWHPVLAVLALAVFTCACLCVVFYLAVFSDISSSADFIYSKF